MSWDGTLIEDLGPRKDNSPKSNQNNSSPKDDKLTKVDSNPIIVHQPVIIQQPINQQPLQSANTGSTPGKNLVALYSYDATETGELTFAEGDAIVLLEENDSGWWRGRLTNGAEGLFPSNFVEEQGKAASPNGGTAGGANAINADFKSLYDYDAEDNTEISIKENDILWVETEKDGWYYGYRKANPSQKGNFPSNFVERC